ncbi:hypothetical protein X566_01360 [Afipia sp. P52-10]|uniref:hypothetical protein n=1 Tax=Afipia sp. P52-10 TaxID=1429916 RepID=UPI0003DF11BA|nr:hypothetical protein [Afipia sp. P52-10]ETR79276.1 hypothetical protein X566_01360 [Afipia sp. P52-10]
MTEKLPGVLAEIADLVGEANAILIAAHAGGTRVYFPARADDNHWLVSCIGRHNADILCSHFAVDGRRGQRVDIPLYVGGTYRQVMRAIHERMHKLDRDDNLSSAEIARQAGVTQRSVHRYRARHRGQTKPNRKQGKLL